jgi:hypothetical protein
MTAGGAAGFCSETTLFGSVTARGGPGTAATAIPANDRPTMAARPEALTFVIRSP